jgi:hypothetical protein
MQIILRANDLENSENNICTCKRCNDFDKMIRKKEPRYTWKKPKPDNTPK